MLGGNSAGKANKTISVKPMPSGGDWQVQISGAREKTFSTKREAKSYGKKVMRASDTLKIYKSSGALQTTQKGPRA